MANPKVVICAKCGCLNSSSKKKCDDCGYVFFTSKEHEIYMNVNFEPKSTKSQIGSKPKPSKPKVSFESKTSNSQVRSDIQYCIKCGAKINTSFNYCSKCGRNIDSIIDLKPSKNRKSLFDLNIFLQFLIAFFIAIAFYSTIYFISFHITLLNGGSIKISDLGQKIGNILGLTIIFWIILAKIKKRFKPN
jgi:ribosomal protein L40E